MLDNFKIMWHQGKQFIPNVTTAMLPGIFRGRPVITKSLNHDISQAEEKSLAALCPTSAISTSPFRLDLGRCTFCGECAAQFPTKIKFTSEYKLSTNVRERLIVYESEDVCNADFENCGSQITLDPSVIRKEIHSIFGRSLKLRQISAGGDNSCELELNASNNVQFDISRFGIDFVASPRHSDGIVITGPITANMAGPLEICYNAIPNPKIIILAGTDAISGGIFEESPAIDREFLSRHTIDLYVPGNPVHPLTFINGVLSLIKGGF